jgi:hypothetical protein
MRAQHGYKKQVACLGGKERSMNPDNKWQKWTGFVLHVLIAALVLFAGSFKLFGSGSIPPDTVQDMARSGLWDKLPLIAVGEITAVVLMVIPVTSPLGVLVTSGFWGGVICFHLLRNELISMVVGSVLLVLTWLGGFLRGSVPLLMMKPDKPSTT